jgi:hypothetical protein
MVLGAPLFSLSGPRRETSADLAGEWGMNHLGRWAAVAVVGMWLGGCSQNDVGAPCNHGNQPAPQQPVVTYPSLNCDELMCVYNESIEIPPDPCTTHEECNEGQSEAVFECVEATCRIRNDYVLSRSMCSRQCESDADCAGGYEGTECRTGFSCARVQRLGDFCCEKLCVCRDDLGNTAAIDRACSEENACGQ